MNRTAELGRLGILGGGQLARMTLQAAIPFGIDVAILAEAADSPAGRLTQRAIVGSWSNSDVLQRFAEHVDVVTLENEFVDADVLRRLAAWGKIVRPDATTLSLIQDKLIQKQTLAAAGLPVPPFQTVDTAADVAAAAATYGWPVIVKARRNGYDGYGNATVRAADEINAAFTKLRPSSAARELMVEAAIPFVRELAVLVVRDPDGHSITYPLVETIQRNHICHIVRAPAPVDPRVASRALELARAAVEAVNGIGITAVELFETANGDVLINELAPRPHNSGHFSIDACSTSQFENHVRAVLGLPLGATDLCVPAAVMVNLLGGRNGSTEPRGIVPALAQPGMHVHLYGKREVRIGRKMGHLTAVGASLPDVQAWALAAAATITL